ncbi:hypothetical protein LWM68_09500 [Niabella sp. W65]|jgi:hypothetical protein|nr:hypothetical protein [Niabella sp. W65]MCH7362982.1 hypothetical protein [Niabella sp. W65]ULT38920.1 hypothetical protein KRR40_28170 [Niabella sp. I65]
MTTSKEVFDYIKSLSAKTLNPQIRIRLSDVLSGFSIEGEKVLVLLAELENRRLIDIHRVSVPSVSLTRYGVQNDYPNGGLESYEA